MINENDKLNGLLKDKMKKIRQLEIEKDQIEENFNENLNKQRRESAKKSDIVGLEAKNAKRKTEELLKLIDDLKETIEKDQTFIQELEEKCVLLATEIERLKFRIEHQKRQSKIENDEFKNKEVTFIK